MKRIFLFATIALLSVGYGAHAQAVKVDEEGLKTKLTKSDEDIANPKKNVKAATWIERGKAYEEAAMAYTKGAYKGMDRKTADLMLQGKSKAKETEKKVGNSTFAVVKYENLTAYFSNSALACWTPNKVIDGNALGKAADAFSKAYELDPKGAAKNAKQGLQDVVNAYKQEAECEYTLANYKTAAKGFEEAYLTGIMPALNVVDTSSLFNAGYLYALSEVFPEGIKYLSEALKLGYENGGDTYYLLYYAYAGDKDMANAKKIAEAGILKYPDNIKIVEALLGYYTTSGEDPSNAIPMVEDAIKKDPKNASLWGGLGRIYDKLGDMDKAIEAFGKSAELAPKNFEANYNYGLLYIKKAEGMNTKFNERIYASQKEFDEGLAEVNKVYAESVAPLEKALALQPTNESAITLLKNVSYRLRNTSPEMMEKYNKYNEMFKAMEAGTLGK